ncbi:MAG: hypothetical protein L0H70_01255 [Xanthomonadales bacterium]|nr:hypothetical protein [Xanthomonadales bacterium]
MRRLSIALLSLIAALLVGCGPTRHVFPPQISVQQLHVDADGQWHLSVRMQNYSYDAAVHFDHIHAQLSLNDVVAATFDFQPNVDVAEQNADVADVTFTPAAAATKVLATNSTGRPSIAYTLTGKVLVTGQDSSHQRSFPIDYHGWLSPVPGIANTYR